MEIHPAVIVYFTGMLLTTPLTYACLKKKFDKAETGVATLTLIALAMIWPVSFVASILSSLFAVLDS